MPKTKVDEAVSVAASDIWMASLVEERAITSLSAYEHNNRRHTKKSIRKLADGIAQFGFVIPIVIKSDGTIIAGHGRVEAAKTLGMAMVPAVVVDHLSDTQVRALRIADNKLASLSEWDEDNLRIEFAELSELVLDGTLDFDLTLTGFEMGEIDFRLAGPSGSAEAAPEIVEFPDTEARAITRQGDLWSLGRHSLLCGDSLEATTYARLLAGTTPRMAFTDPPYNVPVQGHVRSGGATAHREFAMASGEMTADEFYSFLATMFARLREVLPPGAIAMVCMDWRHIQELIRAGKAAGFELINLCVWNKSNGGMGSLYRSKHELVCIFKRPGAPHVNNVELGRHGRNRTNVWDYAGVNSFGKGREADLADHPTVKPTALVADALMDVTDRGDVVLDCFGGSGSTLLAAESTGRVARLIELDPLYCDVAIRRWQEMTGEEAVLDATGESFAEIRGARGEEANDVAA
ncbi:DNA modification methylase [Silicimonas algicola]|uniref:site-specific DNA-methyltransferase (adenine-specific) n=2 Tax=Silicimonas algicola TaxID=1826607 RepID=A0A316G1P7_9RHOB|nr:DNA modification methylase [Silicimonas algicola]